MSKGNGFLQLRRGLWEHVRDGFLTHTGALVYIFMLSEADTRTGIWRGSAQCIAAALRIPRSTAKYCLTRLDGRYIRRFPIPGRHFCYPILLHKYLITDGQHVGLMLDALNSKGERSLEFFKRTQLPAHLPELVQHIGPQKRSKNREDRSKPAAKPTPPADPRYQPFVDYAYRAFQAKHEGQSPVWGKRDFQSLKELLGRSKSLTEAEMQRRWSNYLASTEAFTMKQGCSLAYFCSKFDSFMVGPLLQKGERLDARDALRKTLAASGLDENGRLKPVLN